MTLPMTSTEALRRLMDGNKRFTQGLRSIDAVMSTLKLAELAEKGQSPFAIILTCSDSRVPAEILFDQGVGDLFVIRVAGNVLAPSLLASIEFAALNFKTPLCLVMGHTQCGAIKATLECQSKGTKDLTPSLKELVSRIEPAVQRTVTAMQADASPAELLKLATTNNIGQTAELILKNSEALSRLAAEGRFMVVSALCDIASGSVDFELSQSEQAITAAITQN